MHNGMPHLSLRKSGLKSWNTTTLSGLIIGMTLGGIIGNQTGAFFWQAEIEWGILGMSLAMLSIQLVKRFSKAEAPLITRYAITFIFTILSLQTLQTVNHLLFESVPLLEKGILLFGILLCPLLGWHIAFLVTSWFAEQRETEEFLPIRDPTFAPEKPKLLDSSAIIDGRIFSLCKTGFLQGRLFVPKSILHELQLLADSPHSDKRIRGKRGLEILSQLRALSTIDLVVLDEDILLNLPVDEKLLIHAKTLKGLIITNDWNLAQVANLQGLTTLNINELTYELRPLILPGQTIRVFIQKEGQSPGQGAAHLDDGTLVIIDHGSPAIGRIVEVQVTRYMQTNTGRMIFASLTESLAFNAV